MQQLKKSEKLSWLSKISFGMGAFGKDLVYALVGNLFMFYLTDVRFVAPAFVGTLFMAARIWDAFNDPFMGMVVDNTRTRWGKFRPWIMIGTVLNAIVLALMFWNVNLEGQSFLAYAAVLYILWGMTYTIDDIPYWSMVPALTDDENERSQISAIPRLFASFAWLIVGSFGLKIIDKAGGGDSRTGFAYFAMMVSIIFIVCSAITVINCREKVVTKSAEKTTVKGMLHVLIANDQVKVILGIALFFNFAYQLSNSFSLYYFTYAIGVQDLYPVYTGVAGIAQMAAQFTFPMITKIIGRGKAFFLACFLPVAGFLLLFAVGIIAPTSIAAVGISSAIVNYGIGFMLVFITVMLADVVDYGEYSLGTRNESILFSMQTFIVKFAGAFSGFVSGVGLTIIGWKAGVTPGAGTVMGMKIIMIIIPAALSALCYLFYKKGYKLTGDFYEQMIAQLRARKEN